MKLARLYPDNALQKLEFDRILVLLEEKCISELGRKFVRKIKISADFSFITLALNQVSEMKFIIENESAFPAGNYNDLESLLGYLSINNAVLSEDQFLQLLLFLLTLQDIFEYLKLREGRFPQLEALLKGKIFEEDLLNSIASVISEEGTVRPGVSTLLDKIKKDQKTKEKELNKTFDSLLQQYNANGWLAAGGESIRNGRRVITLLSENKRKVKGIIHDESATGKTIFIEPEITIELSNDLFELQQEERREIYRILRDLTAEVQPYVLTLHFYQQLAGLFDFIRAKALLAIDLKANLAALTQLPAVTLMSAFHPLLYLRNKKANKPVIPISLKLDEQNRILLISGPNAGGKSVSLKTVGLLQVMHQSGMLVSAHPDSTMGVYTKIFVELGDEQSIENELSTYSSRLTHMKYFIEKADIETLFFIDEFGGGTDPKFGGAIAEAILESLNKKKASGVINTHYSNLKLFASNNSGITNGSMGFNKDTLSALYELRIGQPGSSHAFEIAKKIGLPAKVIESAKKKMDQQYHNFDSILATLETDKHLSEIKKTKLDKQEGELQLLIDSYKQLKEELEKNKKKILLETKQKSLESLEKSKLRFDELLKEMRLEEKQKAREEEIRKELQEEKKHISSEINKIKAEKKSAEPLVIEQGSFVRLHEGGQIGVVDELRNNRALVSFGNLRSLVLLDELEVVEKVPDKVRQGKTNTAALGENFEQTIDVRGLRTDEAIKEVESMLDKAMLLGIYSLRILHGKGNGTLRKFIRELLKKYSFVKDFKSEAQEFGGDGITIVELG
jgi:DNA mismatch repair protein MutS2